MSENLRTPIKAKKQVTLKTVIACDRPEDSEEILMSADGLVWKESGATYIEAHFEEAEFLFGLSDGLMTVTRKGAESYTMVLNAHEPSGLVIEANGRPFHMQVATQSLDIDIGAESAEDFGKIHISASYSVGAETASVKNKLDLDIF